MKAIGSLVIKNPMLSYRSAFTLIELLIVIAIIAILAVVVVVTLNPAQLLKQSQDANRLSDLSTMTSAINVYNVDQGGSKTYSLGTPGVIYISIPDPEATSSLGDQCQGLGLSGNYHCAASSTYRDINGTGWLPIDFSLVSIQPPLTILPVDPVNNATSGECYAYETNGTNWEIASSPASQKYSADAANFLTGSTQALLSGCPLSSGGLAIYATSTTAITGLSAGGMGVGFAFDPNTNSVWIGEGYAGNTVTRIDDSTYAETNYTVGNLPESLAFDPHTDTIWVASEGGGTLTQINDATYAALSYGGAGNPSGVAFDTHTNTLWFGNNAGEPNVIDDATHTTSTLYALAGINSAVGPAAFDSHANAILLGYGNGILRVDDTTYATSTYSMSCAPYCQIIGVAFDPHNDTIWVTSSGKSSVTVINDATGASSTYAVAGNPTDMAFDAHTDSMWVDGESVLTQVNDTTYATSTYAVSANTIGFDSHTNAIWAIGNSAITVLTPQ